MHTKHPSFTALMLLLAAAVVTLGACDQDQEPEITSDQAQEAFMVAFGSAYVGSMAAQLGQSLPGVTISDEEEGSVVFEEFDVTELETDYTTVSGTVTSETDSARADLTLAGGPVTTIAFDVTAAELSTEGVFRTTVVINGKEMDIEIDASAGAD
jgi:hypothetical protein